MSLYLGDTPIANTGYDKANIDLSNLTSTGKNIANWSSNVTNCITEIPQDIKLELNNGTLTLKAGSKVYVPNGDGVFDVVTIASDLTATYQDTSDIKCFLFYVNGTLNLGNISVSVSGTTPPTTGFFYNTSTNKISFYLDGNTVWDNGSFPLCIVSCSNSSVNSIDQVFNGFGYIGSTIFALPGVKGLIPKGRNADGTLKNTEFTINTVKTFNNKIIRNNSNLTINQNADIVPHNVLSYDSEKNLNISNNSVVMVCKYATWNADSTGKITSLTPKTAFHALDYNDSSTISGWSMPSSRYIDLTLGASGAQYTAPANGYVILAGELSANTWLNIRDDDTMTNIYQAQQLTTTYSMGYMFAVKKGGKFSVNWGNGYWTGQAWQNFRFVYAEGE